MADLVVVELGEVLGRLGDHKNQLHIGKCLDSLNIVHQNRNKAQQQIQQSQVKDHIADLLYQFNSFIVLKFGGHFTINLEV